MKRLYYISDDLDDLAKIEQELETAGLSKPQIHLFSRDDAGVERRNLHNVQDFMKRDVVHSALWGSLIGFVGAILVLLTAHFSGIAASVHWAPFILLALVILGFCTWEGGLFGMHTPHHELRNFETAIREGKHLLFVDIQPWDTPLLHRIQADHPQLKFVREGTSTPSWAILWQKKWHDLMQAMP